MRWGLRTTLTVGAIAIVAVLVSTIFMVVRALNIQREQYDDLANDLRMAQIKATQLQSHAQGQARSLWAYAATGSVDYLDQFETYRQYADEASNWLAATVESEQGVKLLTALRDAETAVSKAVESLNRLNLTDLRAQLPALMPLMDDYIDAANAIAEYVDGAAGYQEIATIEATNRQRLVVIGLIVGYGVVSAIIALVVIRGVVGVLEQVRAAVVQVADGDLSDVELRYDGNDPVGQMCRSLREMIPALRGLVAGVGDTSRAVTESAAELHATTEEMSRSATMVAEAISQIARGTGEQAAAADNIQSRMRQLREAIDQIAGGAEEQAKQAQRAVEDLAGMLEQLSQASAHVRNVNRLAADALATAQEGQSTVLRSAAGMAEIQASVAATAEQVAGLGELSQQIGAITEAITAIADQTNLLALNAAIEAARAGEHGRGFSVVADEVRKLAERAASSANEIAALISRIQASTTEAVESMNRVNAQVEAGVEMARSAEQGLGRIVTMVRDTQEHAAEVVRVTEKLVEDSRGIQSAVSEMAAVAEENAAATEEMAASSDSVLEAVAVIASSAQETAAAAQEVSASTEELTAGAETIAQSTQRLAGMSRELLSRVGRFRY